MGLKIDRRAAKITKGLGIAVLIAVFLCLLKILIWEHSYYRNKSAETRSIQQSVITELADAVNPSETEVAAQQYAAYQVHTTSPRYLEIPRLELKARVKDSEVNENTMPVPDNIFDVAWYSGSSNPGQDGTILMSGISEGATKPGAFSNLDSLEKGDEITITRGDDEKFTYSVQEITIVDKNEAKNKLPLAQKRIDDKETLSLISARRANENDSNFNSIIIIKATKK